MPNVKIVFWNIENLGDQGNFYGNSQNRCNLIAQAIINTNADVVMVQEYRNGALGTPILLLFNLNAIPGQEWYCDSVAGSLSNNAAMPYATNADVAFTPQGRHEGYVVFWRQNIAKFIMQIADPVDPATVGGAGPVVANTQSTSVIARHGGVFGLGILANNITVPAGPNAYSLPAGSTIGAGGITRAGAVVVAAGITGAPITINAGDILPAGTIPGPGGITLTAPTQAVFPIVIPANYTLPAAYTLPANGAVVVPQHAISLVLTGRPYLPNGANANFVPAAVNNWSLLRFADGIGALYGHPRLTRRPATCTVRVSTGGAAAAELIPITVYHTPLNAPGMVGMAMASNCRSLYQAYDHTIPGYIDCNRAIIGGDFNKRLNPAAGHFRAYTDNFNMGGAGCNQVLGAVTTPNIRVNAPFVPLPAPVYPPLPAVPTAANNPNNKSLILLRQNFTGPHVLSNNIDHFRSSAFDNVFYRGFTPLQVPNHAFGNLYFLPAAVSGTVPQAPNFYIPAAIIQGFLQLPVFHPGGAAIPVAPVAIPNVRNPATLLADIQAGGFGSAAAGQAGPVAVTGIAAPAAGAGPYAGPVPLPVVIPPQRRAIEFVKLFVSDHLPVIFEMNL
ncbi:hypothetical protein [Chitinophaga sancti]|uniref:hypothetical protein n=1 Tax=Chitinophaga sancti TaxID=1004 RepID=UPI003F7B268A